MPLLTLKDLCQSFWRSAESGQRRNMEGKKTNDGLLEADVQELIV